MKNTIFYNNKQFTKTYQGLKAYLEEKVWNLHREEKEFQQNYKKQIKALNKKFPKLSKEEKLLVKAIRGWNQQIGKIIFISCFLEEGWGKNKISDRVWKERGWKLSKDRNRIIKK